MFSQIFLWFLLFLYLAPILISGIIILRKISLIDRYEILIPTGFVLGISLFTFFVNIFSFVSAGKPAIYLAYLFIITVGIIFFKIKFKVSKITFPSGRALFFLIISLILWTVLIFWKGNNALIGSDTNLYFSIAHTFLKGNFPPMTPWQPDLPLSYHIGSSELLASFYQFTDLSFEFLHIFFSCFFILLSSQMIIWFWKRHHTVFSFVTGNIIAAVILISFGFFKLTIPNLPFRFPNVTNFHQFFLWLRDLPTVNQSIEVYGAPINLDALIYFIFHSFGLALALCLITLTFYQRTDKPFLSWIFLAVGLASLALINESIFVSIAPAIIIGQLILEIINKTIKKNIKAIILISIATILIVVLQGGVITNTFFPKTNLEKSILFFPNKTDSKEDFTAYHYNQEISKALPIKEEWFPFRWFSIGVEVLISLALILLIFMKDPRDKVITLIFFLSGFFSLLAYNLIVPKFLVANGNRFLAFSFIFLALSIFFSLQKILSEAKRKNYVNILLLSLAVMFIILPTIIPPLTLLTKNRFSDKRLIAKTEQKTNGIKWIEKNIPFSKRVMVLDARAPHPSGQARAMVQAGVFAPIFLGDFRAYTIEASPEYFDIAYFLSPSALKKLKISTLLIDSDYFLNLPENRKKQLTDEKYFKKIFEDNNEKIYLIDNQYLERGGEINGTFNQLTQIFPKSGSVYIDNEENFSPNYLRRAIIFSLRDKDIYFLPQSGVYLNVEADINQHPPRENSSYDYLVLGKYTNPKNLCKCQTQLIWQGIRDEVSVFRIL